MTRQEQQLIKIYQDFVTSKKSIDQMALTHGMSLIDMQTLIESGRALHSQYSKDK